MREPYSLNHSSSLVQIGTRQPEERDFPQERSTASRKLLTKRSASGSDESIHGLNSTRSVISASRFSLGVHVTFRLSINCLVADRVACRRVAASGTSNGIPNFNFSKGSTK